MKSFSTTLSILAVLLWASQASATIGAFNIIKKPTTIELEAIALSSSIEAPQIDEVRGHAALYRDNFLRLTKDCNKSRVGSNAVLCIATAKELEPTDGCEYCSDVRPTEIGATWARGYKNGTQVDEASSADYGRTCDWWGG